MARKKPVRRRSARRPGRRVNLEWTVPATPEAANHILLEVMQALRRSRCRCGDLDEVRLALREALNNAVKHGSLLNPEKQIHLACRCTAHDGLWVMIRDQGRGFDPGKVPDPTRPENLERFSGRGLYMIRELMDQVEFREHGREIHLRRRPRR